ncbi:TetR/AcrR family transcriptional regulator [Paenibacillus sp. NFR01]|uniref:TetR/AcrR family transcriptional regulator n=1 Tax=Paenibacillus sp. NFR01 TaxID=1566279 RepID=UPI0008AB2733|nr:TetR/AcrR family transcriptional regulator [Paenibacillus sp. NFR01]SET06668.1 transcriptional regulator, TetR family [Paenibacillus sp. NFR01]
MSPRNVEKDLQQRALRKKQIIDAAFTMFTKRGIEACKMSDIAQCAGLSHGHVYNYFQSKEELLDTLIQRSQQLYTDMLTHAGQQPGNALDQIRWLTEYYLADYRTGKAYWVLLQAQASDLLSDAKKQDIHQRMMHNQQLLAGIIRKGQQEGCITAGDPEELALITVTLLTGIGMWEIRGFTHSSASAHEHLLKLLSAN